MGDPVSTIALAVPSLISTVGPMFGYDPQKSAQQDAEDAANEAAERNARMNQEMAERNAAAWKENAFPSQQVIETERSKGMAQAGGERSKRYEQLARSLSMRGIGAGSPYSAGKAAGIEGSYLDMVSALNNNLTKMQYTPTMSYPFQSSAGAGGGVSYPTTSGGGSNPLGLAMGMMMAKNMFQNNNSTYPNMFGNDYTYGA